MSSRGPRKPDIAVESGGAGQFWEDPPSGSGIAWASSFAYFSAIVPDRSNWATFGGKFQHQNAGDDNYAASR